MPIDKFVLLLVVIVAAAAGTVFIASLVAGAALMPGPAWLIVVPVMLVGYVIWRVIADRIGNAEDDKYDRIEK